VGFGVEIDKIAATHVDRTDTKAHGPCIDAIEIDQLFECQPEPTSIVKARSLHGAGRMKPRRWKTRREEAGRATYQSEIGADLVLPLPRGIALCQKQALTPAAAMFGGDALPECTQLVDARFRRIAGDQRRIDGADRDARDPVGMKIGLGQCLINPGLIRT